jgi:hypothetical protein
MAKVPIFLDQEEVSGKLFLRMDLGSDDINLQRVEEGDEEGDQSSLIRGVELEHRITFGVVTIDKEVLFVDSGGWDGGRRSGIETLFDVLRYMGKFILLKLFSEIEPKEFAAVRKFADIHIDEIVD